METKITCPKCGHDFNVEDVLSQRIEEKYREELNDKISEMEKTFLKKETVLKQQEQKLKAQSADMERQIEEKAKAETAAKESAIKKKIAEEFEVKVQSLTETAAEAKQKLAEMKATLLENAKLKRQMEEQEQNFKNEYDLKLEQQLSLLMKEKATAIQNSEKERFEILRQREKEEEALKVKELEVKLEAQIKLADEMKRKAEQGSTQLQGEVQELVLEKMLRDMYEREGDEISEVGKGQRGADVLHVVKTRLGNTCGKVYYESKRTQKFDDKWLEKLRDDNTKVGADVLVIVTQAMPTGQDHFFRKDGVWICPFWEAKALSFVLRDGIQRVHETRDFQHGKETKMEEIYDYLTGNDFRVQFNAILEGFKSLQDSYTKERKQMETLWELRAKQLDKVFQNAAKFYGSIRFIAGRSIPVMNMLEPPETTLLEADVDLPSEK